MSEGSYLWIDTPASDLYKDGASKIAEADKHNDSEKGIRVDKSSQTFTFIPFPLCGLMHTSQTSQALSNLVMASNAECFP